MSEKEMLKQLKDGVDKLRGEVQQLMKQISSLEERMKDNLSLITGICDDISIVRMEIQGLRKDINEWRRNEKSLM